MSDEIKEILDATDKSRLEVSESEKKAFMSEREEEASVPKRNFWILLSSGIAMVLLFVGINRTFVKTKNYNQNNLVLYRFMEEIEKDLEVLESIETDYSYLAYED